MQYLIDALSRPNMKGLLTAPTLKQLKATVIETMLREILPEEFVTSYSENKGELVLMNGFKMLLIPSDDEEKIRSLNVSLALAEEVSGIKKNVYTQILTRLRESKDPKIVNRLYVCSNPDNNWIRDEFYINEQRSDPKHIEHQLHNSMVKSFFVKSSDNVYLPPNFIDMISRGKDKAWIERYVNASFDYSELTIYPTFHDALINDHEISPNTSEKDKDAYGIPKDWERIIGVDVGVRNPTVFLFGAIDEANKRVIIYNEYYEPNRNVKQHAKFVQPLLWSIPQGRLRTIVADPAIKSTNADLQVGRNWKQLYQDEGIFLTVGNNNVAAGISKARAWLENGAIRIRRNCINLYKEGTNYTYKQSEEGKQINEEEKPVKYNDHAVDALRYLVMYLPEHWDKLKHSRRNTNELTPLQQRLIGKGKVFTYGEGGDYDE